MLHQQLFSVDRQLRVTLLEIRRLCLLISSDIRYFESNIPESLKFEDFKSLQEAYRIQTMETKFETFESTIKDYVVNSCHKSLIAFKEENRIPIREEEVGGGSLEEQAPLLVGDESGKEMPYTQEATVRTHFKRLKRFVKLIDYLIIDSKLKMMNNSTVTLVNTLKDITETYIESKDANRYFKTNPSWLIVEVNLKELRLFYDPQVDKIRALFDEMVTKGIQKICTKHKQLQSVPELAQYTRNNDDEEVSEDTLDLQLIIYSNNNFRENSNRVKVEVDRAFDNIVEQANKLDVFLKIYQENTSSNQINYEQKEIDEIRQLIQKFKN